MPLFKIANGTVYDPANNLDGVVRALTNPVWAEHL